MRELLLRIVRLGGEILGVVSAIAEIVTRTAKRLEYLIELIERREPGMSLAFGVVYNVQTGELLPMDSNPIALTNSANPAQATRYLGAVDVANPTNPPTLPTITSSNPSVLAIVAATALDANNKLAFGAYPIDTAAETNDTATVTISMAGQPDIVLDFTISGQPVPPPETDTLDAGGAVGAFPNAPTLPASPV